jgi:hypothetical protein
MPDEASTQSPSPKKTGGVNGPPRLHPVIGHHTSKNPVIRSKFCCVLQACCMARTPEESVPCGAASCGIVLGEPTCPSQQQQGSSSTAPPPRSSSRSTTSGPHNVPPTTFQHLPPRLARQAPARDPLPLSFARRVQANHKRAGAGHRGELDYPGP